MFQQIYCCVFREKILLRAFHSQKVYLLLAGSTLRRLTLQEGAPIYDVKDEEGERKEKSGNLVDVNGGGTSFAALVVLNHWRSHWTSVSLGIWPHRCLWDTKPKNILLE